MAVAPGFQAVFVRPPNPPSCFEVFIIQGEQKCGLRKLQFGRCHPTEGWPYHLATTPG